MWSSISKVGFFCALAGIVVALGCLVASEAYKVLFGDWTIAIWPSSVFLMATSGRENEWISYEIIVVAIAVNAALYGLAGTILWYAIRRLHAWSSPK